LGPTQVTDQTGKNWWLIDSDGYGLVNVKDSVLPTDASTESKQDDLITELKLKADLTETQPVSNASLPLPSGASTSLKQLANDHDVNVSNMIPFTEPIILKYEDEDEMSLTVNDYLSGLLELKVGAACKVEERSSVDECEVK